MSLRRSRWPVVLMLAGVAVTLVACGGAQARKARYLERGQRYLHDGNLEKARVEFQNALQIAPVDTEARYEMGVVSEKLGKLREAAQFYQGALDVDPENLGARTALARMYTFAGNADKTLELVKPALLKHPDDAELLTLRASARVQQKDLAGGQQDAERAVQLDPKNEDAIGSLAGIYSSQQQPDKARKLLEDSVARLPQTVDLRLALAQIYGQENRPADVERLLLELVKLKPRDKAQRIRLAQFYASRNEADAAEHTLRDAVAALPEERDLKLALVDFLAARRSPAAAEKELSGMIAAAPSDNELKFALARFYTTTGQAPKAESIYQQVIDVQKLEPDGLAARDQLAQLRLRRNDVDGALKLIGEVLAKSPRDDEALLLRGDIELSRKDPKAAIADLRSVLRDQPNAVGVLRALARAHVANGESALAEETLRRALDANPRDPGLRLDLAQLLARMGKPEQAKPLLADLAKEHPEDTATLDALFKVSATLKDYVTAESAADALVSARPKSAAGYVYRGMLAEQQEHADEALKFYAKAGELQPDALEPLQGEVRVLVEQKRGAEALKRLDEAAQSTPKAAAPLLLKGDLLLSQGRAADAQAAYQAASERAPRWWLPYSGVARAQIAAKQPQAALDTLRAAVAKVDQSEELQIEVAQYLAQFNRPEEAQSAYEAILAHDPQSDVAANNLAMLLVTYKKDPASLQRAKTLAARFADSGNLSFLDTYGWVLARTGDAAAAVPVLERVVNDAPESPVARYHLGMAQTGVGNTAAARDELSRALKSGAKFTGSDEARATLEKLATLSASSAPKS